jgi:hypothetical protein
MARKRTIGPTVQIVKRFRDVNQVMDDIENEISAIKSGDLSESKARVVAKNRQMQIDAINLLLQAARIEARFRPALAGRLGLEVIPEPKQIPQ